MDRDLREKIAEVRSRIKLSKNEADVQELYDLLFSAGKIPAALNVFELALGKPAAEVEARIEPGKQGRACFERALEFADGYLFEDAVHGILKGMTLGYETYETHYCLAGIYKSMENWPAAERHCRFSIALRENFIPTYLLLASLLKRKQQFQLCAELCLKSIGFDPDCAIAYYDLACYYALQSLENEALLALENTLAKGFSDFQFLLRDPDFETLWANPRFLLLLQLHQIKKT